VVHGGTLTFGATALRLPALPSWRMRSLAVADTARGNGAWLLCSRGSADGSRARLPNAQVRT